MAGRSIEYSAIARAQMQLQDTYRSGVFPFKFASLDPENGVSLTFANGATTSFIAQDLLRGATVNAQSYRVSFNMGSGTTILKVVVQNCLLQPDRPNPVACRTALCSCRANMAMRLSVPLAGLTVPAFQLLGPHQPGK